MCLRVPVPVFVRDRFKLVARAAPPQTVTQTCRSSWVVVLRFCSSVRALPIERRANAIIARNIYMGEAEPPPLTWLDLASQLPTGCDVAAIGKRRELFAACDSSGRGHVSPGQLCAGLERGLPPEYAALVRACRPILARACASARGLRLVDAERSHGTLVSANLAKQPRTPRTASNASKAPFVLMAATSDAGAWPTGPTGGEGGGVYVTWLEFEPCLSYVRFVIGVWQALPKPSSGPSPTSATTGRGGIVLSRSTHPSALASMRP